MKVLLVKTSSMGDVLHTLPAVSDARAAISDLQIDWVVEEPFAEIPTWHPAVNDVIPVAVRRWRKNLLAADTRREIAAYRARVKRERYDLILDAQGLLKSAVLSSCARGPRAGLDRHSAREGIASWFYRRRAHVRRDLHAIERVRRLFSLVLGYERASGAHELIDYGIAGHEFGAAAGDSDYLVFLHATTWASKHWPQAYWRELADLAGAAGREVYLPWGNPVEHQSAERIAEGKSHCEVLPKLGLGDIAARLSAARGAVAVDTGLAHLCAALEVPTVTLYGSTNADLTGTLGKHQLRGVADYDCAPCLRRECKVPRGEQAYPPCYTSLPPARVWSMLNGAMQEAG